jgi:predicted nuclease of predicted toxin-antitoxin system
MKLWLNAQLPPLLASWIQAQERGIQAYAFRDVGRRAARHPVIFRAAQEAGVRGDEQGARPRPPAG